MSQQLNTSVAVVGIDISKNSFHVVGLDKRGAIVLRQKWSRGVDIARADPGAPGPPGRYCGEPNRDASMRADLCCLRKAIVCAIRR
jgi:hypothetical protein